MAGSDGQSCVDPGAGLTRRLVERALRVRTDALPDDVRRVARDCLADWIACAIAGLAEPASAIVREAAREEGGHPQATVLGQPWKASLAQAALVNGTASHALDYDDVNLAVPGHMTVAIVPALFALAEHRGASAGDFTGAFVAGYEFACRVGTLVEPAHYANGFHATATIGSLGAAMACAHLLGLPAETACHAIGLAATQAAGLKAMFGTMAKPLHAGLASQSGLRAARLAARGFVARPDVLECGQGFAQVHGGDFDPDAALAEPAGGDYLLRNLFKFHAACYSTHSTIEAVAALRREHALAAAQVSAIRVVAGEGCSICNIQQPSTGLEAKFSLRATAAFALLGIDTGALETWDRVVEPAVTDVLERVEVDLVPGMSLSESRVAIVRADGTEIVRAHDCGEAPADKAVQSRRIAAKFRAIAGPALGDVRARALLGALDAFGGETPVARLAELCAAPAR